MPDLFGHNYSLYPFQLFHYHHLTMLLIFFFCCGVIYLYRIPLEKYDQVNILVMFLTLLGLEVIYHTWLVLGDQWHPSFALPFQLCSISLLLALLLLITKNRVIFQLVYYLGLAGALQAILTPELFVGYPHFRFFQFFVTHMMIIWIALYFLFVKSYKPTLKGLGISFSFLNVVSVFVFFINHWVGGNYMFLAKKPTNPTILDYLGPYPYYIISLEILALFIFLILFMPFREKQSGSVRQKG